jgi:hypothetical protein
MISLYSRTPRKGISSLLPSLRLIWDRVVASGVVLPSSRIGVQSSRAILSTAYVL